jgi:general secretion pathway protein H
MSRHPLSRGFTLLEIMVVIVIASVLVTIVTLSVSGVATRDIPREEVRRLEALSRMVADQAMIQGREHGLLLTRDGYRFLEYFDDEGWQPSDDRALRFREWPDGLRVEIQADGRPLELRARDLVGNTPQVLFTPTGEMTPFRILLRESARHDGHILTGKMTGALERAREGE